MAQGRMWTLISVLFLIAMAAVAGCGKDPTPVTPQALHPETELTFAPLEGDTASYRIHFFWNGYDTDGEVTQFRFALDADTAKPFSEWTPTTAKDTTLLFLVDPVKEVLGHVFWVVAEDNSGRFDLTPAKRFFSAKTVPPISRITRGPNAPGTIIGPNFTFEWEGVDPDGGETGGAAPVDSFEYLLLQNGAQLDPGHPPLNLPAGRADWVKMICEATGPGLPAPYDDWKWTGVRGKRKRFRNVTPGYYVFAVRAVDIAGATEKLITASGPPVPGVSWAMPRLPASDPRNIRDFNVTNRNPGPLLTISSSVLVNPLPAASGPEDIPRKDIQIFEGETISFSWTATGESYGGEIVGYAAALDDTSTAAWGSIDLLNTSVTFTNLSVGPHFLFVRAVDDGGLVTNVKIPLRIVHPSFKDPIAGKPKVLYVDDFAAPVGDWFSAVRGGPNYPPDSQIEQNLSASVEDTWWRSKILIPLGQEFGVDITHDDAHDTVLLSTMSIEGRGVFTPEELAKYRSIIWYVDFNNTISSPTALWRTLVGGSYSELAGYLRAGGTVILTGFMLASQTSQFPDAAYSNFTRGMCNGIDEGSPNFRGSYFLRNFLGLDGALGNDVAQRSAGARDFVEARVTPGGAALGFVSAPVDTGGAGSGAKWDPWAFPGLNRDTRHAPGLPKVEGWRMREQTGAFACLPENIKIRKENASQRIAIPIFTYHGVPQGAFFESGPSPREGLTCGIAIQAHDLGNSGFASDVPITFDTSKGVIGRMVVLGFPIYYIEDAQAYQNMRAAFAWVNASPTLPSYSP